MALVSTAPAVAAPGVAVPLTLSDNNTITIADGTSSVSTPTGKGKWDSYLVVGTNSTLDKYCYSFLSTTGKYTESDTCTYNGSSGVTDPNSTNPVAGGGTGTGGAGSGGTVVTAPTETVTTLKNFTFDSSLEGWRSPSTQTSVDTLAPQKHTGSGALRAYSYSSTMPVASVYPSGGGFTTVVGQKYRVTAWVYQETGQNVYILVNSDKSNVVTTNKVWTQITVDYTAKTTNDSIDIRPTSYGTNTGINSIYYVDDVTVAKIS